MPNGSRQNDILILLIFRIKIIAYNETIQNLLQRSYNEEIQ